MSSHLGWMLVVDGVHDNHCGHVPRTLLTAIQRSCNSPREIGPCLLTHKERKAGVPASRYMLSRVEVFAAVAGSCRSVRSSLPMVSARNSNARCRISSFRSRECGLGPTPSPETVFRSCVRTRLLCRTSRRGQSVRLCHAPPRLSTIALSQPRVSRPAFHRAYSECPLSCR
jgi:hypothetical protein